jgi:2-keto-4-pentenoate hydratase
MTTSKSIQAARLVWHHRQSGQAMAHFPDAIRPHNRQEGYAAQAALQHINAQALAGWKIAATSQAGQQHIGVSGPLAGRIFKPTVIPQGQAVSLQGVRMLVAEPEMCFVMGHDLPPRPAPYTQDEVMAAVSALHVAIEVPNSRFADFVQAGEASLIADNACAHAFVLGDAAVCDWRGIDLSKHAVSAQVHHADGNTWNRAGNGSAVLGDPRIAMTWIANELSSLGLTLERGQFVTTGTCMVPLEIAVGDTVEADFGALGRISVRFAL